MRLATVCALVFVILFSAYASGANTCVQGPPRKVSGTLRGIVEDPTGERIAKAQIHVVDEKGQRVADIHADDSGGSSCIFHCCQKGSTP